MWIVHELDCITSVANNDIFFWQQRRIFAHANAEEEGGRETVLFLPIRFQYAGIFIAIGLLCANIYRWPYVYSAQTWAKFGLRRTHVKVTCVIIIKYIIYVRIQFILFFYYYGIFYCYCILTLRWLMSYIYGAPILDVSRSHTTTQHSR